MKKMAKLAFTTDLLQWNSKQNIRKMPWKGEKDPYRVWLSEIILQQTRVEQGMAYYNKFIKHYPTVQDLASASDEKVLKDWEGLGYYSRCRNLLFTARQIVSEFNGKFPRTYCELILLKGIGTYTAAAIASFAFDEARAVVDGNVYRVLSRFFGISTPVDGAKGKKQYALLAQELLDKRNSGAYNQAIMDFGAIVCKPAPVCKDCPLQKHCIAFRNGEQTDYPVKEKKLIRKKRYFQYLIIENDGNVLVRKRSEKDIWQGLYEFVQSESNEPILGDDFIKSQALLKFTRGNYKILSTGFDKQDLTHQTIHAIFVRLELPKLPSLSGYIKVSKKEMAKMAFPKLLQNRLD